MLTLSAFLHKHQNRIEQVLGWLVFGVLSLLAYGLFFQIPYVGFYWQTPDYQVVEVFIPDSDVQVGDFLLEVNSQPITVYAQQSTQPLFAGCQPGDVVPVLIERDGQRKEVAWTMPGQTGAEVWNRLSNQWWLGFVFWGTGQLALLFIWPRTQRRQLFIAFCFLTALWLSASSVSQARIFNSPTLLRSVLWLCVPVYWHFHWCLPKQISPLSRRLTLSLYGGAGVLAAAEWLQILPPTFYLVGFLLALLGSLVIVIWHFLRQPESRVDLIPLGIAAGLAIGLPLITVAAAVSGISWQAFLIGFASLPLLPFTYFYIAYRQQEVRANQVASLYLYLVLITSSLVLGLPLLDRWFNFPGGSLILAIAATLGATLFTLYGYDRFRRLVERYILNIPIPPPDLLRTYAERVATSATQADLVHLLTQQVLPSLLVRQSALYVWEAETVRLIYTQGLTVSEQSLPDLSSSWFENNRRHSASAIGTLTQAPQWVRLPLVLTIAGQPIGLWLLGQRDPDNQYPPEVIEILLALANQTAIALSNLLQSERVRALLQVNLKQTESQRADLAHELHDNLLQVLAHLETNLDENTTPPRVFELLDSLVVNIRATISDLRPPILDYGLRAALEALADSLVGRGSAEVLVLLQTSGDEVRYEPMIELHVYRIIQQACENAVQHAQAPLIQIEGRLDREQLSLKVSDTGQGFDVPDNPTLTELVARQHYGLAGMRERAEMVGAILRLESQRGQGTTISVEWMAGIE